ARLRARRRIRTRRPRRPRCTRRPPACGTGGSAAAGELRELLERRLRLAVLLQQAGARAPLAEALAVDVVPPRVPDDGLRVELLAVLEEVAERRLQVRGLLLRRLHQRRVRALGGPA